MNKNEIITRLAEKFNSEEVALQIAYKLVADSTNYKNDYIKNFETTTIKNTYIQDEIKNLELNIVDIQNLFEASIDNQDKKENGIVYTPGYIVDYIIKSTINFNDLANSIVVDPACGCGAFLTGLINKLNEWDTDRLCSFISNKLYGFDLNERCKKDVELVINVQLLLLNKSSNDLKINVITMDSLFCDWSSILPEKPKYVIGNPPYVKVQNMNKDYMAKLKSEFETTKSGGFNLFYAFIEKSMSALSSDGFLGFITPNNFLKIKSGADLRNYIASNKYLSKIIDFDCNMIFAPVMTYNCIMILNKKGNELIDYVVLEKTSDIRDSLKKTTFNSIHTSDLDKDGWLFLPNSVKNIIGKIERFDNKLDKQIKTGIATLRDKYYIIDKVKNGKYYKILDSVEYEIEKEMVRPLYKVSDIGDVNNIENDKKFIIFPYDDNRKKPRPLSQELMKINYPLTLKYFEAIKPVLDERNKFKVTEYYEYGRSQGINNTGAKLLYSQFLGKPKFIMCTDDLALLCNGFAIYEDERLDLKCLQRIIQSEVMDFYIKNTSYSIEGGFHCYQKKYLKNFSFPSLTDEQIDYILSENDETKLNSYIWKLYL